VEYFANPSAAQMLLLQKSLANTSRVSGVIGLSGAVAVDIIHIQTAIAEGDIDKSLALVHRMGWGMVGTAIGVTALSIFS